MIHGFQYQTDNSGDKQIFRADLVYYNTTFSQNAGYKSQNDDLTSPYSGPSDIWGSLDIWITFMFLYKWKMPLQLSHIYTCLIRIVIFDKGAVIMKNWESKEWNRVEFHHYIANVLLTKMSHTDKMTAYLNCRVRL